MAAATQQNLLSPRGGQKRFDFVQQIGRMSGCQIRGGRDSAGHQNPRIKASQVGDATDEPAFGLPAADRVCLDVGQSQGIRQSIGILLHEMGDVSDLQTSQAGRCDRINRGPLIDGAVD